MDGLYIILALQTIICFGALYTVKVFDFADEGVAYLRQLAYDNPVKLNNNSDVLLVLKNRDLPNMTAFAFGRTTIQGNLILVILMNVVLYVFYPFDGLFYSWMKYVFIAAGIFYNLDAWLIFRTMHANKRLVSTICNAYHNLIIEYEQNAKMLETSKQINMEHDRLMVDINKAFEKLDEDRKNADNEE